MPEFAAPAWLIGLIAIPVIWWLYRTGAAGPTVVVPTLAPWQDTRREPAATDADRRPDPRWWLRAGGVALLLATLAEPGWRADARALTIWFDDSASMGTREGDGSRIDLALDAVSKHLAGATARLRSLSAHRLVADVDDGATSALRQTLSDWTSAGRELTVPRTLDATREHWLVTDGADPVAARLMTSTLFTKVLIVGGMTENVAIERMGLRRSLEDAARFDGSIVVFNAGHLPARRTLVISGADAAPVTRTIDLPPGERMIHRFSAPITGAPVRARLDPADALPVDDRMALSALPLLPLAVTVSAACSEGLQRGLEAHPGILLSRTSDPGDSACLVNPAGGMPLRLRQPLHPVAASGVPAWATAPPGPATPTGQLHATLDTRGPGHLPGAQEVLLRLTGDNRVLATRTDGFIDVHFDLAADPDASDRDLHLALLGGLLDRAAGRSLLDPLVVAARPPASLRIAPPPPGRHDRAEAGAATRVLPPLTPIATEPPAPLAHWLLVAALVLVGCELFLGVRGHARDRFRKPGAEYEG